LRKLTRKENEKLKRRSGQNKKNKNSNGKNKNKNENNKNNLGNAPGENAEESANEITGKATDETASTDNENSITEIDNGNLNNELTSAELSQISKLETEAAQIESSVTPKILMALSQGWNGNEEKQDKDYMSKINGSVVIKLG